jgi:hypothetical protein
MPPFDDHYEGDGWRDKVVYASVHAHLLNSWEQGFIENLMGWSGRPTDKQMERIQVIFNKLKARVPK